MARACFRWPVTSSSLPRSHCCSWSKVGQAGIICTTHALAKACMATACPPCHNGIIQQQDARESTQLKYVLGVPRTGLPDHTCRSKGSRSCCVWVSARLQQVSASRWRAAYRARFKAARASWPYAGRYPEPCSPAFLLLLQPGSATQANGKQLHAMRTRASISRPAGWCVAGTPLKSPQNP